MKKANIFLIHYAGGSCYSYQFLTPYLHQFGIYSLELPGRGKRIREPLLNNLSDAVSDVHRQIRPLINPETDIIFGHSLGAILGFLVTSALEKESLRPRHLIVSGNSGPGIMDSEFLHNLPTVELKKRLLALGGFPHELLENRELFEFYEPILRADLKVAESAGGIKNTKISTPIYCMMGTGEKDTDLIGNWENYTAAEFKYELFEGDHFFIHNHIERIVEIVTGLTGCHEGV